MGNVGVTRRKSRAVNDKKERKLPFFLFFTGMVNNILILAVILQKMLK